MFEDISKEEFECEAICTNCFDIYDRPVEPDAHGIECPSCHKTSVQSLYMCLGVI